MALSLTACGAKEETAATTAAPAATEAAKEAATEAAPAADDAKVVVFWYDESDVYLGSVRDAMNKEFEALGITPDNQFAANNQSTQIDQINTAIAGGADILVVRLCNLFNLFSWLLVLLYPLGVILQLALPLYACAVCILVCKLNSASVLVCVAIPHFVVYKLAVVGCIKVNPVVECAPLLVSELHAVVTSLQDANKFACRSVVLVWFHYINISLGALTIYVGVEV